MKGLLLISLLFFTSISSAKLECTRIKEGGNGECEFNEVKETNSLRITTENEFSIWNPLTWFSSGKDKATREIKTGGKMSVDANFNDDETTAPRRNIPDPEALKKEQFKNVEELKRSGVLSKSQLALIEKHRTLINGVAEADALARRNLGEMNSSLRAIHQRLEPLDKSMEAASREFNECVNTKADCKNSELKLLEKAKGVAEVREMRNPVVKEWNDSMAAYNKKLDDFKQHTLTFDKQMSPYMSEDGVLRQQIANLSIDLKREEITREFQDKRYDLMHIDDQLDDLERTYDRARIGAYVQDKIGHLLTSDILCKITSTKCVNGKNDAVLEKEELIEIFPKIKENRNSREKYQKRSVQSVEE